MAKKATESGRRAVDSFEEAAGKARVSVAEFREWMLTKARGYTGKQWSAWENRRRPIPERFVIDFMHDKRESPPESTGVARRR